MERLHRRVEIEPIGIRRPEAARPDGRVQREAEVLVNLSTHPIDSGIYERIVVSTIGRYPERMLQAVTRDIVVRQTRTTLRER